MSETTDFLVIGSGVAGLRAAIGLASGSAQVTVLTKDRLDESNSGYAQGGVAVALSDDDEIDLHFEDTLAAGLTSALRSIDALASTTADERTAGIIILARPVATAALWREESRGAHYRVDFPHRADPEWQLHSGQQKDQEIHGLPLN